MKKKFLSLMMAAAMVATTSVSAFADETATTVTQDGSEVKVTVSGSVNNESDTPPAGTLSVTVPTALTFSVNNSGDLTGSEIVVTNRGTQKIDVFAYQFIDLTPQAGIVVKQSLASGEKRNGVTLMLEGGEAAAHLSSEPGTHKGIYGEGVGDDGLKIAVVETGSQNSETLTLSGTAGTAALTGSEAEKGISEKFTLRLKIKKATT